LIAHETGTTIPFAMFKLQERGKFFVPPGVDVYEGQIVGENSRENDLVVNVIRTKKLTNMRSSGADDKVKIAPHIQLRKILLKEHERKRAGNPNLVM